MNILYSYQTIELDMAEEGRNVDLTIRFFANREEGMGGGGGGE